MRSMRSVVPMRIAKIGYILISAIMCVLGIVLMAVPKFSLSVLGIICGIIMIVFGVVRLIGYFSKDLYRLAFQYDLLFGITMIVIGIMMLVNPGDLMTVICIAMGISIFAEAICKIKISIDAKDFGIRMWWLILASAIAAGLFGIVLIFRPGAGGRLLTVLLGISLLTEGILNIITVATAVKIIKNQQPDVIEVDYEESN